MDKRELILEEFKQSNQASFYSISRFDALTIAISGGGLYFCFEFFKLYHADEKMTFWPVAIASFGFLIAIVVNFVSQIVAYKLHTHINHEKGYRLDMAFDDELDEEYETGKTYKQWYMAKIEDSKSDAKPYRDAVVGLNICSNVAVFAGLLCLILFCVLILL